MVRQPYTIVGVLPPMVQIAGVLFHLDDVAVMSLFFGVALLSAPPTLAAIGPTGSLESYDKVKARLV